MTESNINTITDLSVSSIAQDTASNKPTKKKKEKNIQKLALAFINNPTESNFGLLCERINWGLRSYIFKIVNDDDATTDVLTRTFENIYFKRDQFDPTKAQFSTWMYRIALNNSLKYIQEKKMHGQHIGVDFSDLYDSTLCMEPDETTNTEAFTVSDETDIMVVDGKYQVYDKERIISEMHDASINCIGMLPDNLKVVMKEKLLNNKKIYEIAYDNQIPISSVKNWLRRGRIELAEKVKQNYTELYNMYIELAQ